MDKCEKCDLCLWNQGSGGGGGGGGSSTLAGLTDVDISNPSDRQALVYDASSEKWVNGAGGGASAYFVDCTYGLDQNDNMQLTSTKTASEIRSAVESGSLVYIRYIFPATDVTPAFTHVYILDGMFFGTMDDITAISFSFMRIDSGGTHDMYSGYTMPSDYPVFIETRQDE